MGKRLQYRLPHRPNIISLLPLAPTIQAAPPDATLARIQKPAIQPFKDISTDHRLTCWTRSIHVFPAAYPRSIVGSAVHEAVLPTYLRSQDAGTIAHDIRARNVHAERRIESELGAVDNEPQLFIAAARYFNHSESVKTRENQATNGEEPITLILTHANGFHKETWEPMLAHLLLSPGGRKIKEIWALDCANHGDSAILNRSTLGLNFDWADNARDLLNFVLLYLPEQHSSDSSLPMVLPPLDCPHPQLLQLDKSPPLNTCGPVCWRHRRLGLMGHSLGGCASMLAVTSIPELFAEVTLVDPAIAPTHGTDISAAIRLVSLAVTRQNEWESRAAALKKFRTNKTFYGRWDPLVLKRYVEHALESDQLVKLKCNKLHEASVFTQCHGRGPEAYHRLLNLSNKNINEKQTIMPSNDQLPFRFLLILGNQAESIVPEEAVCNFGFVRMNQSGHLVVQENPLKLAVLISKHLTESRYLPPIDKAPDFTPSKL
ncbi:hypothetical protein PTTG_04581 [Puccinia triticina 1-1 BBBD Race 1]|uniref:AB hydrolase-1 domain-containing protein n=2 Tax=Puccinia triticina TaxID=208348 RepID=A0A180H2W2_PUCT1|nr:uncharacterized protein PtA15_8A605 [Puccinia triticina]OAV99340.1 hypothetical protein PTTG_04581 [Puccinia triticina 1-1 BBBD Race 1]WAQ87699.1 hypothetical protein PtA15_8A605 [Puccinia triticina]WAR57580.1 hypothetical protein PtB15_8B632 [Puccinia triticina]